MLSFIYLFCLERVYFHDFKPQIFIHSKSPNVVILYILFMRLIGSFMFFGHYLELINFNWPFIRIYVANCLSLKFSKMPQKIAWKESLNHSKFPICII